MSDKPVYTRRRFMQSGLVVVSTASTIPTFLQHSAVALADPLDTSRITSLPGVPQDRILIVVQLSGGNDGLNTVVPYGHRGYYDTRPGIAVPQSQALRLGGKADNQGVGFHPSLANLKDMIDNGLAAVVQGVGYPNPNRSHFASMDIWHTCQMRSRRGTGWLGRAMDQFTFEKNAAMVAIGNKAPLACIGEHGAPVSFENANLFRWAGADLHKALGKHYEQINRAGVLSGIGEDAIEATSQAAFVMRTALDAQLVSDRIRGAVAKGTITNFPDGQLANQLRMVASMIRAGLPTRVYYVGLGGFDTHSGQLGRHANLLREFASAMQAFYRELKAMGDDGRVLSMAFSEFGRRVHQNASQGTDHGTAGPMYLFGPMVRPGLLGEHPSLSELDNGDLIYNIDFRSVYAAVLDTWLKTDSRKILGLAFRHARVLDAKVKA